MTDRELLAWVATILERERGRECTGAIRVELHQGKIQRIRVEAVEKPGGEG